MKLSTKGRYGVRALVDIAANSHGGPVMLKDIAQRQGISAQYLEHLVAPLIRAGVLRSIRGPRGGIVLAVAPEQVTVARIIGVLEGSVAPVECVDNPGMCSRSDRCAARDVWSDIKAAVTGVLESVTLADLVARQRSKTAPKSETCTI